MSNMKFINELCAAFYSEHEHPGGGEINKDNMDTSALSFNN